MSIEVSSLSKPSLAPFIGANDGSGVRLEVLSAPISSNNSENG